MLIWHMLEDIEQAECAKRLPAYLYVRIGKYKWTRTG